MYSLDLLLQNMLFSKSKATTFYMFVLQHNTQDSIKCNLISRVKCMCHFNNIQFMQYIINDRYLNHKRKQMNTLYIQGTDSLTDMVQWVLNNCTSCIKAQLMQILRSV